MVFDRARLKGRDCFQGTVGTLSKRDLEEAEPDGSSHWARSPGSEMAQGQARIQFQPETISACPHGARRARMAPELSPWKQGG